MEGIILDYSSETEIGIIRGNDAVRYEFTASEYRSKSTITVGQTVDFDIDPTNNTVSSIFVIPEVKPPTSQSVIPQAVMEGGKDAVTDTLTVFQALQKDPANGLQAALQSLGDNRAFNTGIVLSALFAIASWAAIIKGAEFFLNFANAFSSGISRGFGGSRFDIAFSDHIKILLLSSFPALGIIFILWAIKQIFKGKGNIKQFTFATGVSIFPITLLLFVTWLFGYTNLDFLSLLSVFCFTTLILLLNTTLIGVLQLSSRNALFLVPIVLVADTFIVRVLSSILIR
jgi:hypothetical protein